MSLYVYSGVPGSGKTYHAVRDMRFNRAPVITNVKVSGLDNVAVLPLEQITPELLMAYSHHYFATHKYKENTLLLVIDEAQLLFNSRSWNDANRMDWLAFLSQHRKYGYRCVFVAQDIKMIDKQFRCLCEFDVRHTAASSISLVTRALSLLGVRFTCAKYYNFDSDVLVFRDLYKIGKRTYRYYNTSQDILAPDLLVCDLTPVLSQIGGECAPPQRQRVGAPSQSGDSTEDAGADGDDDLLLVDG
ncbi:zonular occludens toxin domain-containing protein [Eggerthella sinensis]|uniref:zonular occludens toxin domain-containing protein n=1 Tax=Eggerthella sinensis TaxID=242230 RepID=UPI00248D85E6|nr:zonular occludens toxin domain-containing protein [Eggerthella sinensis]